MVVQQRFLPAGRTMEQNRCNMLSIGHFWPEIGNFPMKILFNSDKNDSSWSNDDGIKK